MARELAHLHEELAAGRQRVVTYFGFAYRNKGVELLFKIADPERDRIVLLCDLREANPYQKHILEMCQLPPWTNSIRVTGFLPIARVADILAASDAVVLPFPGGGGDWNSTLNAVLAQGTLAISTSLSQEGYDPATNVFYCKPGDVSSMVFGLANYSGKKIDPSRDPDKDWERSADSHLDVYMHTINKI